MRSILYIAIGHDIQVNPVNEDVVLHKLKFKPLLGYYLNARMLKKLYNEIKPDIINVHFASGYGTLARIAKISPIVLSVWGSDVYRFPKKNIINKIIFTRNVMYANKITSTSNTMAKKLKEIIPKLNKKIEIIPFGIDVQKFKKYDIKDKNINNSNSRTFNIGNVKTLQKKYGIEYGILAVKLLIEKLNQKGDTMLADKIRLYIYGKGNKRKKLQKIIEKNSLQNTVILKGEISNESVPDVLNSVDVFCVTSNEESFGVSVVEAMACNLPIVATDTEGFTEVIHNGIEGIIVKRKNVQEIASALEKLIYDEKLRVSMGQAGRSEVLKKYNFKDNTQSMKKVYSNVIKDNKNKFKK